jgi:hypothetical protein
MQIDAPLNDAYPADVPQGASGGGRSSWLADITNGLGPVLVVGAQPDLPGLILVSDPAQPCAAMFLMGTVNETELAAVISTMPDPAVPVAHFGDCTSGRSDFLADACNATTLAAARMRFAPIMRRLQELPFHPTREDRRGLLTLRLAYSRNCSIEACFAPGERTVIKYSLLHSQASARTELEGLADLGLLRRRHFIRTHSCHHCGSLRLIAHEACPGCGGSDLIDEAIVHHYRCGCQQAGSAFVSGASLICPKCRRELLHLGIDYGKPGTIVRCRCCGMESQEPDPVFVCTDCHARTDGRQAMALDWFHYDLTDLGIQALRERCLAVGPAPSPVRTFRKV